MKTYEQLRRDYKPDEIRYLLIAESPPPPAEFKGSRHFYRADQPRPDDRLFTNTIKAVYPEAADKAEAELEANKETWLRRLQNDGFYMTEALEKSQAHKVTKAQRQEQITKQLSRLIERVRELAGPQTKIILIKSNVFVVAAQPLRDAGFNVLNTELVDYPGHFNQQAYRRKLSQLISS